MAGMFYSMKEVVDKLGTSEDDVRKLVKAGRLREFRDGSNLLFKVEEVESLMSDTGVMAARAAAAKPTEPEKPEEEDEILLAPEQPEAPAMPIELSDADTQIVEEGIRVLGETDAKDALEETKGMGAVKEGGPEETAAAADEASLKEIEGDVNLDTFGSGSGLLDLSLQADDTSLGGILDEIYTPEGEGKAKPADEAGEGEAPEAEAVPEAEPILAEEGIAEPQIGQAVAVGASAYAEAAPDTMSNALGLMLWIPLLATIYTAIAAVAGFNNIMPSVLLKPVQGFIWYVVIGLAVVSGLIVGGAMAMSGEKKPKQPKPPKVKKEKPKKEKKGKESKGK